MYVGIILTRACEDIGGLHIALQAPYTGEKGRYQISPHYLAPDLSPCLCGVLDIEPKLAGRHF